MAIGYGNFITLDTLSKINAWVGFQLLFNISSGIVINSIVLSLLISLLSSEVATATVI